MRREYLLSTMLTSNKTFNHSRKENKLIRLKRENEELKQKFFKKVIEEFLFVIDNMIYPSQNANKSIDEQIKHLKMLNQFLIDDKNWSRWQTHANPVLK